MKGFCTRSIFLITTTLIDALNSCSAFLNSHEDDSNVTRVYGSLTGRLGTGDSTTLFSGSFKIKETDCENKAIKNKK